MPEGDTVYKVAAYLRTELQGRRLASGRADTPRPVDLAGLQVSDVYARGKHLFIALDDRLLRSHLGMHGSWHRYARGEAWQRSERQAAIVLDTGEDVFVCFNAQQVELLRQGGLREREIRAQLGPDLLAPPVDHDEILRRIDRYADAQTPVVDLLLDQRIAAGIGNVYKSEVLFIERCHPLTPRAALDADSLRVLYVRATELLAQNTGGGPRVTRRRADDAGGLWVYGRGGQPCLVCDTPIVMARQGRGMRSTYWCPGCQLASKGATFVDPRRR